MKQKQLLFKLRSRSVHTKANYKNKYKFELSCSLCKDKDTEENDSHLLVCPAILPLLKHPEYLKDYWKTYLSKLRLPEYIQKYSKL